MIIVHIRLVLILGLISSSCWSRLHPSLVLVFILCSRRRIYPSHHPPARLRIIPCTVSAYSIIPCTYTFSWSSLSSSCHRRCYPHCHLVVVPIPIPSMSSSSHYAYRRCLRFPPSLA